MKDETIGVWHDPEVEVRIVAMVLGEASDFEKAELERMIAEDSGLKQFYSEMSDLHGGVLSAVQKDDDAGWKLSTERRNSVLGKLGQPTELVVPAAAQKESNTSRYQWRSFMSIAACLLITLFIMAVMFPARMTQNVKSQPVIISYSAAYDSDKQSEELEESMEFIDGIIAEENIPTPAMENVVLAKRKPKKNQQLAKEKSLWSQSSTVLLSDNLSMNETAYSSRKSKMQGREDSRFSAVATPTTDDLEGISRTERQLSAPSSSMAKVIASSSTTPAAVPVPDIAVAEPSLDFGNGDDFGEGWGDGDGSGGGGFGTTHGDTSPNVANIISGGKRSGDYAIASDNGLKGADKEIRKIEIVGSEYAKKGAVDELSLGALKTSERLDSSKLNRPILLSLGSTSDTDAVRIQSLKDAPSDGSEFKKSKSEAVRKNLYRGERYRNLGKYEEADEEFKEVLRKDRYNKAARRGLEKIANSKSDYYRAAYDQTRAEFLMEVDKAWEIAVPPDAEQEDTARLVKAAQKEEASTDKSSKLQELEEQKKIPVTDEISAADQTHSTFSLNVSDASYKLAKAALLERGEWPTADSIRTEEFINAFDYGDPKPSMAQKVACVQEQAVHPFLQQRNLLRVSMSTAAQGRSTPLNLVVLLDKSGSMERPDRAATALRAMEELGKQLGPNDRVSLMSFARDTRLLVDNLSGDRAGELVKVMKNRPSEGGTNLEQAMQVAQQHLLARQKKGVQSRIVVLTDGAANLGDANPENMTAMVEKMRDAGIAFDACGIGFDGLDDGILEALTRKGDGRYYVLDKPEDADASFGKKIAGALRPAAKNVKVQVVFNPDRVGKYKLLGFEKHRLKKEDFRNDAVDAAEMAAEESGSALYQIEAMADGSGALGTVFVRFQDMATGQMVERSWTIPYQENAKSLAASKPTIQLAAVAGLLGEKLHQSDAGTVDFSQISNVLGNLSSQFSENKKVQELLQMVRKVQQ
jgi:Mg-chelatase subunit ChlD